MADHRYFRIIHGPVPNSKCRAIAASILNLYLQKDFSVSKWRKTKPFDIEWGDAADRKRTRIDYDNFVQYMHDVGKADVSKSGLPALMSPLFDSPVDVGLPQAIVGSDGDTVKLRLPLAMGDSFPLVPMIDREGFAIADMQTLVEKNIANLFRYLVESSHLAPQPHSGWLTSFRQLIMECVTAVDMMLHKVYLLAEYRGKELGWRFDAGVMGPRHATRLMDKFKWISYVSNRPFSLSPANHEGFKKLKQIRNHLAHFDPPCFAATLAEVADWLNCVHDIGEILWSIRRHFAQQLSETTVEVLLLPRVEFIGCAIFDRTPAPHDQTIGYRSASWR